MRSGSGRSIHLVAALITRSFGELRAQASVRGELTTLGPLPFSRLTLRPPSDVASDLAEFKENIC